MSKLFDRRFFDSKDGHEEGNRRESKCDDEKHPYANSLCLWRIHSEYRSDEGRREKCHVHERETSNAVTLFLRDLGFLKLNIGHFAGETRLLDAAKVENLSSRSSA